MKKFLAIIVAAVLTCGLFIGCGNNSKNTNTSQPAKVTGNNNTPTVNNNQNNNQNNNSNANNNNQNSNQNNTSSSQNNTPVSNNNSTTVSNQQKVIPVPVTIINDTDIDIAELYVSGEGVDNWGNNILGNGLSFGPGDGINVTFYIDENNLRWDFKTVDHYGDYLQFSGLDLSNCSVNGITITLTYDRSTNTGYISAK